MKGKRVKVSVMKILFIGDIVGRVGRQAVKHYLPALKKKHKVNLTIANGENAAGGKGITRPIFKELMQVGIDVVTMGNHTWDKREVYQFIDQEDKIIRPANYPNSDQVPGKGITYVQVNDQELAIINLHGRALMGDLEDPFRVGLDLVDQANKRTPHIFVDFHAETTSEKEAMGWFLDGKASALVGTHTHVQTNDNRILPNGTAYVSDVGMTGFADGILGMERQAILNKFLTQLPARIKAPEVGEARLNASLVNIDKFGRAGSIEMIRIDKENPFYI